MANTQTVDLQHEADNEGPRATNEEASERLERFKQGEIDRWGREVGVNTPVEAFYIERR